jgi:hypothetical protein
VVHVPVHEAYRHLRGAHPWAGQEVAGRGSAVWVPDAVWAQGAVPSCGTGWALVENGMKHMGCDAGMGAWELRPDADLGPDFRSLALLLFAVKPYYS